MRRDEPTSIHSVFWLWIDFFLGHCWVLWWRQYPSVSVQCWTTNPLHVTMLPPSVALYCHSLPSPYLLIYTHTYKLYQFKLELFWLTVLMICELQLLSLWVDTVVVNWCWLHSGRTTPSKSILIKLTNANTTESHIHLIWWLSITGVLLLLILLGIIFGKVNEIITFLLLFAVHRESSHQIRCSLILGRTALLSWRQHWLWLLLMPTILTIAWQCCWWILLGYLQRAKIKVLKVLLLWTNTWL